MLIYLGATVTGLFPNEEQLVLKGRAVLCENIAVNSSLLVKLGAWGALKSTIDTSVARSPELLSVGVRSKSGKLISESETHTASWGAGQQQPTKDKIQRFAVPVLAGDESWGQIEFCMTPLNGASQGFFGNLLYHLRMPLFMFSGCFLVFFVYLGIMLTQLDPAKTVPSRVRAALDSLTEGLLILDIRGRIVLANGSFNELVGSGDESHLGKRPEKHFKWLERDGRDVASFPWTEAAQSNQSILDRVMILESGNKQSKRFVLKVNCAPVIGHSSQKNGVLISFEDVTELESSKLAA